MYEFAYNEIVEESAQAMRACEARALDRVIGMLRDAEPSGPKSRQGTILCCRCSMPST